MHVTLDVRDKLAISTKQDFHDYVMNRYVIQWKRDLGTGKLGPSCNMFNKYVNTCMQTSQHLNCYVEGMQRCTRMQIMKAKGVNLILISIGLQVQVAGIMQVAETEAWLWQKLYQGENSDLIRVSCQFVHCAREWNMHTACTGSVWVFFHIANSFSCSKHSLLQ